MSASMTSNPFIPEILDARYSKEFYRRLQDCFGGPPDAASPAHHRFYLSWWRDHAGGRSDDFRRHLLPTLERSRPLAGLNVLDFGCGTGSSTIVLAEQGARVTGLDPDPMSLSVAEQRVKDLGYEARVDVKQIPYLTHDTDRLPVPDASFDLATLIGVLEHMLPGERRQCVRELARVLKPNGEVFVYDTPNRLFPYDHHTTKLWFVPWLPLRMARMYAVFRGRLEKSEDFQRRGGVGVSRRAIDGLFPASEWTLVREKSASDVFGELAWAATQTPDVLRKARHVIAACLLGSMWPLVRTARLFAVRPSAWTASHVLMYRKRA